METPPRQHLLPWLWLPVLVAGLALTWLLANQASQHNERLMGHVLTEQHRGVMALLNQNVAHLMTAGHLLAHPAPAAEAEFRARSRQLLDRSPGLTAVEYIQTVGQAQRQQLEQTLSRELGREVMLSTWDSRQTVPAPPAEQYLVVRWAEGSPGQSAVPGLVADTVPHWQNALLRSLTQDVVATTSRTDLQRNGGHASALRVFLPAGEGALVSLAVAPSPWLGNILADSHFGSVEVSVHDLSQHVKTALLTLPAQGEAVPDQALRSELLFGDRQWMVTTTPTLAFLKQGSGELQQRVWLAGLALTGVTAAALALLGRRLRQAWRHRELAEAQGARLQQRLDNAQVEKNILRQALENSEQRSRDLVALSGGFVCELDERQRVAYLSSQAGDLLDRAPTDLAEQPFQVLVAPSDQDRFQATLQAARRDRTVARVDLHLLDAADDPVPVTLRVAAVTEPISGCTGYRLTGQARES